MQQRMGILHTLPVVLVGTQTYSWLVVKARSGCAALPSTAKDV